MIIYYSLGVLSGIFLLWLKNKKPTQVINQTFSTTPVKSGHISPKYYGYHGGYWNVNKCNSCDRIGMYEDMHTASACPYCGGRVSEYASAIFKVHEGEKQWVLSTGPIILPMEEVNNEIERLIKYVNATPMPIGISNHLAQGLHGLLKKLGLPRSKQV